MHRATQTSHLKACLVCALSDRGIISMGKYMTPGNTFCPLVYKDQACFPLVCSDASLTCTADYSLFFLNYKQPISCHKIMQNIADIRILI